VLINDESESKQEAVSGLLSGQGAFNDISCKSIPLTRQHKSYSLTDARLLDIVQSFLNPPREPTPLPVEPDTVTEDNSEHSHSESQALAGVPTTSGSGTGSFHFMQASELETTDFENTAEWVEKSEVELTQNGVTEHTEPTPLAPEEDVSQKISLKYSVL